MPSSTPGNPYEAPRADLFEPGDATPVVPDDLGGRMLLALRLYLFNLPLIAVPTLLVWLPVSYFVESTIAQTHELDVAMLSIRLHSFAELIFGPFVTSAVIWSLAERHAGRTPTVSALLKAGFDSWGRLFAAKFVASFLVLIGVLALIVPGIYLIIRFSLIDAVVVLEGAGPTHARHRSAALVTGRAWEILFVYFAFLFPALLLTLVLGLLVEFTPSLQDVGTQVIIDCIGVFAALPLSIILLVYYWERRQAEDSHLPILASDPA